MEKLRKLIGKHMNSTRSLQTDWSGYWPTVDNDGIITGICDGDAVPEDATLVDWDGKKLIVVDGNHGFGAIRDE